MVSDDGMSSRSSETILKSLKLFGPHVLIFLLVGFYIVIGGVIFLHLETSSTDTRVTDAVLLANIINRSGFSNEMEDNFANFSSEPAQCSEADVEVLFDALYRGCCSSSLQDTEDCFRALRNELVECLQIIQVSKRLSASSKEQQSSNSNWDYYSAIVLAFTIVTTIGYGHIAPTTPAGRVFCVFYGLLGIPLTLLAIADHGRFLSSVLSFFYRKLKSFASKFCSWKCLTDDDDEDYDEESLSPSFLLVIYILYLIVGSYLLGNWEANWTFLDALYFNFISLSTIGFGDVVPKNYTYLPFSLLYIGFGLILSSTAIDILAQYLRKLHQFGAKIQNVTSARIWFGGKNLSVKDLVSTVGKYLGATDEVMAQMMENLDQLVVQTIEEKETGIPMDSQMLNTPHLYNEDENLTNRTVTPKTPKPVIAQPSPPKQPPTPKQGFGGDVDFIDDRDEA